MFRWAMRKRDRRVAAVQGLKPWQYNERLTKPASDSESTNWLRRFAAWTLRV